MFVEVGVVEVVGSLVVVVEGTSEGRVPYRLEVVASLQEGRIRWW